MKETLHFSISIPFLIRRILELVYDQLYEKYELETEFGVNKIMLQTHIMPIHDFIIGTLDVELEEKLNMWVKKHYPDHKEEFCLTTEILFLYAEHWIMKLREREDYIAQVEKNIFYKEIEQYSYCVADKKTLKVYPCRLGQHWQMVTKIISETLGIECLYQDTKIKIAEEYISKNIILHGNTFEIGYYSLHDKCNKRHYEYCDRNNLPIEIH